MAIPSYAIDEVMQRNDIADVIGAHTQLTQRGAGYIGLCPFHKERTPSFHVSADKQVYHCFGCGESGNVVGFIMKTENVGYVDAIKFLADRVHYVLPASEFSRGESQKKELKEKIFELNKIAARFFYDRLNAPEGARAAEYLEKRGVSPAMQRRFGLGYAPDKKEMLLQFCYTKGISSDIIEKSGLFIFENGARDKFINRLMFPIFEPFGKITGFGGRALNESRVKYLNSPETAVFEKSKNLYAINFARKSKAGVFLLCEGYMDVIALHQAGFTGAVAALGTAFNKYHANLLKRYTKKCALIFDSDEAGTKAALRALPVLEEAGIAVSVLSLKGAKDPDEYIKTYGRDAFAEALSKAVSGVTFRIGCVKDKYDLNKPEDKTAFGTEAAGILAELPNVIEQSAYAKEIAKIADIPPEAVIAEIRKKTGGITAAPLALGRKKDGAGSIMAQKSLISILNGSVPAALAVKEHLPPGCLGNGIYAGLLSVIYENACNGKSLAPAELINTFEEYDAQKTAAEAFIDEPLPLSGGVLTGIVREILIDYYEKQADILGKSGDAVALNEILVKRRGVNQIRVESEGVLL